MRLFLDHYPVMARVQVGQRVHVRSHVDGNDPSEVASTHWRMIPTLILIIVETIANWQSLTGTAGRRVFRDW